MALEKAGVGRIIGREPDPTAGGNIYSEGAWFFMLPQCVVIFLIFIFGCGYFFNNNINFVFYL